jgi:hypothetical protein
MINSELNDTQLRVIQNATKHGMLEELRPYLSLDESGKPHLSGRHLEYLYKFGIKHKVVPENLCLALTKLNSKNKPIFKADYLFWIFRTYLLNVEVDYLVKLDDKGKPSTKIEDIHSVYSENAKQIILRKTNNDIDFLSDYMKLTHCPYFNEIALEFVINNVPNRIRGNQIDDHINYFDALDLGTSCYMSLEYLKYSLKKDISGKPVFSPLQVQQIYLSGHFKVDLETIANPMNTWEQMCRINELAEKNLSSELGADFLTWYGQSWKNGEEEIPWMIALLKNNQK